MCLFNHGKILAMGKSETSRSPSCIPIEIWFHLNFHIEKFFFITKRLIVSDSLGTKKNRLFKLYIGPQYFENILQFFVNILNISFGDVYHYDTQLLYGHVKYYVIVYLLLITWTMHFLTDISEWLENFWFMYTINIIFEILIMLIYTTLI